MDSSVLVAQILVSLGTVALIATSVIQVKGVYKSKSLLQLSSMLLFCACTACVMLWIAAIMGMVKNNNSYKSSSLPINVSAILINILLFILNFSLIKAKRKIHKEAKKAKISPEEYHRKVIAPKIEGKRCCVLALLGWTGKKTKNSAKQGEDKPEQVK